MVMGYSIMQGNNLSVAIPSPLGILTPKTEDTIPLDGMGLREQR